MSIAVRLGVSTLLIFLGAALGGWIAWGWQDNAYSRRLADQSANYGQQLAIKELDYGRERETATAEALSQLAEQQLNRRSLEERLRDNSQAHWKEMKDAEENQARLRDRLATADVRLSVLVDAGAFATQDCGYGVPEAAGPGSMVHGAVRAHIESAHAQRIITITDDGDRGLIALKACQAYVREIIR